MDNTLKSLREAFQNIKYKRSKGSFDVYAFLLATSLDRQFIIDYLSFFHELHYLTGGRILIIGPYLDEPLKHGKFGIFRSNLHTISEIIKHDHQLSETSNAFTQDVTNRFLRFMHDQTRESYDIAKFIGLRIDAMPAMVFFEDLNSSRDYVAWNLFGLTGEQFVSKLRHLVGELNERCGWKLKDHINSLETSISNENFSYELRDNLRESREKLLRAHAVVSFYEKLRALRLAYDSACNNPGLRISLVNIGNTIQLLESGQVTEECFQHLRNYYKRWKSRLPADYRAALEQFANLHSNELMNNDQAIISREEANDDVIWLEPKVQELTDAYESKRRQKLNDLQRQLNEARESATHGKESPLAVISQFTSTAGTAVNHELPPINLHSIHQAGQSKIPRVFISYSHDSDSHKKSVLDIAQKLRKDGVDCWIDQFEQNPSQGFPRWMQQQIDHADFVLLVCTASYKRRFDGIEEAGRGLGVNFEGHLILQELYDSSTRSHKYIPIIFPSGLREDIPRVLRGSMAYQVPSEYESLYRRITNQPTVLPTQLGSLRAY